MFGIPEDSSFCLAFLWSQIMLYVRWLCDTFLAAVSSSEPYFPFSLLSFLACGTMHIFLRVIAVAQGYYSMHDRVSDNWRLWIRLLTVHLHEHQKPPRTPFFMILPDRIKNHVHIPVHLASLCYGFDMCGSVFYRQQINHCFTIHHFWVLGNEGVFLSTLAIEVGERAIEMCDRRPENWIKQG